MRIEPPRPQRLRIQGSSDKKNANQHSNWPSSELVNYEACSVVVGEGCPRTVSDQPNERIDPQGQVREMRESRSDWAPCEEAPPQPQRVYQN